MEADARVLERLAGWDGGDGPLYRRLAGALKGAILAGAIPPGSRLPPERALAEALSVSRTTVVAAYDLLEEGALVERRQGSGTWLSAPAAPVEPGGPGPARHEPGPPSLRLSAFHALIQAAPPEVGLAASSIEPLPMVAEAARAAAAAVTPGQGGYAPLGIPALREAIAGRYRSLGLQARPEEILVTSGAQQAIALTARLLAGRGEAVVIENPTYPGAIDAFEGVGARLLPVRVGDAHASPGELLDAASRGRAAAIFVVPSFNNPTGAVMPAEARRELARGAQERGVAVVEDLTLTDLWFEDAPPPPIASHAPSSLSGSAPVITIGSASKLFWGGLRIGWIRAPEQVIARLVRLKVAADLGSSLLSQAAAAHLVPRTDQAASERRARLIPRLELAGSLLRDLLPGWEWEHPPGGLFVWARMPAGSASDLAEVARRRGVEILPGPALSADGSFDDHIRLPLTPSEEQIRRGMQMLAQAWGEYSAGAPRAGRRLEVLV